MTAVFCLKIGSEGFDGDEIGARIEEFAEQDNWPPELTFRVNLVVEELALNALTHGRPDHDPEIVVRITSDETTLTMDIEDNGKPFNPMEDAPEPVLAGAMDDRPIGGLGIHLVSELMDEMHYRRERGRNHLTLKTRRVE